MSQELTIAIVLILAGFLVLAFLVRKWILEIGQKKEPSEEMLSLLRITHSRMNEQSQSFNERLDNAARVIGAVQKNIGEMSEIGRGMKELQEFLQSPKLRGNIGEQVLKELLNQMLPKQAFFLQYSFKSGVVVDAAIKTSNGIIPIDSKFPMESFRRINTATDNTQREVARKEFARDVKKHVNDIAFKYIATEEGTLDYALMYVPSEAVFYEIANDPELSDYAHDKRVLPVSPMTFYAYMKAILMSFEGQKIEARAKEILITLRAIQKDYGKVEESLGILNRHIGNAYNQMNNVLGGFTLLGQKLSSTHELSEETKKTIPDTPEKLN